MTAASAETGLVAAAGRLIRSPLVVAGLLLAVLLALGEAVSPGFAGLGQIVRLLSIAALLGIVAAGQNLVILGGREGIDLSVGAVISLGAVIAGNIMQGDNAMVLPAILGTVLVGGCIGVINGLGVTLLRIPPLVMTLGMLGVVQGGLVALTRGIPSGNAAPVLSAFITRPLIAGIPGILFIWAGLGVCMAWLLKRTAFGYRLYAIGTNERAAALTGVSIGRMRIALFGLSGFFAGLTGVFVLGYTGNSFIGVGDQYMLPSIIAVVLGGTPLSGGQGAYTGTMAGAFLLVVLQSILITLQMEEFGRQIVFGTTLLILMLFYGRQRRLRV
ncbi:MAG: ABC transporter permease [Desulfobacterales bacterium]|nr:ABC transporter permease [Desulfobacterales bacterium]MDJ0856696.1 ABC transporter permease [Desulfobacterales bacterium]MDJ0989021.1 ABC transporter permease [Desulfobacterales bacterium]